MLLTELRKRFFLFSFGVFVQAVRNNTHFTIIFNQMPTSYAKIQKGKNQHNQKWYLLSLSLNISDGRNQMMINQFWYFLTKIINIMIKSLLRASCRPLAYLVVPRPLLFTQSYFNFAKTSKKEEQKAEKKKQKEQTKQSLGGKINQIDLNKYQEAYNTVITNLKEQLLTIRAGRLEAAAVLRAPCKIGSQNYTVADLGQVSAKGANCCIVSPFDSYQVDAIQKSLKIWDDNLEVKKVQNTIVLTQINQGKEIKEKLLQRVKKIIGDRREELKSLRSKTQDELKKYKKVIPEDRFRTIENEAKALFDKKNQQIDKIEKDKEKELAK